MTRRELGLKVKPPSQALSCPELARHVVRLLDLDEDRVAKIKVQTPSVGLSHFSLVPGSLVKLRQQHCTLFESDTSGVCLRDHLIVISPCGQPSAERVPGCRKDHLFGHYGWGFSLLRIYLLMHASPRFSGSRMCGPLVQLVQLARHRCSCCRIRWFG